HGLVAVFEAVVALTAISAGRSFDDAASLTLFLFGEPALGGGKSRHQSKRGGHDPRAAHQSGRQTATHQHPPNQVQAMECGEKAAYFYHETPSLERPLATVFGGYCAPLRRNRTVRRPAPRQGRRASGV